MKTYFQISTLCEISADLCASVVKLLQKDLPQRHRDRTENHRVYRMNRGSL
jgi:hypothetical protein